MSLRTARTAVLAAGFAGAVASQGVAAAGTNAPAPAATAPETVQRALDRLAERGVRPDAARLEDELLAAVVAGVDPGGDLLGTARFHDLEMERQGRIRGIGVRLVVSNGQTRVAEVMAGGPAAGKLKVGDVVDRIAERYVTGIPLDTQAAWIRGCTGEVSVSVVRAGGPKPVDVAIAPAAVRQSGLAADEHLPGGVRRIEIRGFWAGTAKELADVWRRAATNDGPGVILDLRTAGGGDAAEAAEAARLACAPSAPMFALENLSDGKQTEYRGGTEPPLKGPLMLLTGPATTGAAEVFAAALKAGGQGVLLVGGATAGDPLIREGIPFDAERRLYVTTRRLRVAGAPAEVPVRPHVEVAPGPGTRATERTAEAPETIAANPRRKALEEEAVDEALRRRIEGDAVLERAVDILHALHALGPEARHAAQGASR